MTATREVLLYRAAVDDAILRLLEDVADSDRAEVLRILEIGQLKEESQSAQVLLEEIMRTRVAQKADRGASEHMEHFRARAAAGSSEEGLRLLDKLDAEESPEGS